MNFTLTLGPSGNGTVSAGKIANFGDLYIGTRTLTLSDGYIQELSSAYGELHLNIFQTRAGNIRATKRAVLGGRISITGINVPRGRSYAILTSTEGISGRFDDVFLSGISGRHIYGSNAVLVFVDP